MTTQERFDAHVQEALSLKGNKVIAVALQGSQNYGLAHEKSDVDTKALLVPSFNDIVFNASPVSTTHVRRNDEHIDLKDVRLMLQTFRKQNINFVEILFTDYMWVNPDYEKDYHLLLTNREFIARYNPYRAVKCMKGMALEKYHAMKHPYPSKAEVLAEMGYDPKQLHHILRLREFMNRYIAEEPYADCLKSKEADYLIAVKKGYYTLDKAEEVAASALRQITQVADIYCNQVPNEGNVATEELLNTVQYNIMKTAIKKEFEK